MLTLGKAARFSGVVHYALDAKLEAGQEPTKTTLCEAVVEFAFKRALR